MADCKLPKKLELLGNAFVLSAGELRLPLPTVAVAKFETALALEDIALYDSPIDATGAADELVEYIALGAAADADGTEAGRASDVPDGTGLIINGDEAGGSAVIVLAVEPPKLICAFVPD